MSMSGAPEPKRRRGGPDHGHGHGNNARSNKRVAGTGPGIEVMQKERVLSKIGSFLPASDLLALRETCKRWNVAYIPSLRKGHTPIQLNNARKVEPRVRVRGPLPGGGGCMLPHPYGGVESGSVKGRKIAEFNKDMKTVAAGSEIPFVDYELWIDEYADQRDLEEFLTLCGPSARSVRLEPPWCDEVDLDQFRQLLTSNFPELAKLELNLDHSYSAIKDGAEATLPHDAVAVICPKLSQLALSVRSEEWIVDQDSDSVGALKLFLTALLNGAARLKILTLKHDIDIILPIVRKCDWLPNLSTLELADQPTAKDMKILNEMAMARSGSGPRLRLTGFHIALGSRSKSPDFLGGDPEFGKQFHKFLVGQAGTLRALGLKTYHPLRGPAARDRLTSQDPSSARVQIPRMANLREFRLVRRGGRQFKLSFDGGGNANELTFPALTKLVYENSNTSLVRTYFTEQDDWIAKGHGGVAELDLTLSLPRPDEELGFLDRFGAAFRSVTRLELTIASSVMSESIQTTWTSWPGLESAIVKCQGGLRNEEKLLSVDLDQALSGVTAPSTRRQKNELLLNLGSISIEEVRTRLDRIKTRPGLSDMTRLQKLVLDFSGSACTPLLGDAGGYFGLSMATNELQHFSIVRRRCLDNPVTKAKGGNGISISIQCKEMIQRQLVPYAYLNL